MHGLDRFDYNEESTVFRDVIMLALLGFVTIVILLLPHLNPPKAAAVDTPPPGNIVVEVRWPDELDSDIDLWVEAPEDVPVGYSNKGGKIFNLLRDDLGKRGDPTDINYEVAYSRGAPAGDYTVNLHLYSNNAGQLPVEAVVAVGVRRTPDDPAQPIATERVPLGRVGEELTVVRFSIDDTGGLTPGSIHKVPKELRSARR